MTLSLVRPIAEPRHAVDSFPDLYRRYHLRLRRLAASRFPRQDSDDIAQEAMCRLLTHLERLDPMRDPWPYLATICINVGRDLVERTGRAPCWEVGPDDYPPAPPADESSLDAVGNQWVTEVLSCLPPGPRRVLALHALEGMTISEIADLLGRTDNAVRQLLFRARREARLLLIGTTASASDLASRPRAAGPDGSRAASARG